ncbi:ankyrin-3-like isoform X2 [Phymastichus coffea]|nr:ankyrin-3-like isoform X2 [Phymastichus coffea]
MVNLVSSEKTAMEICTSRPTAKVAIGNAAVFPRNFATTARCAHRLCGPARRSFVFYTTTTTINSDQRHNFTRCSIMTLVDSEGQQQEATWYKELMRTVTRVNIAINDGIDSIRQTPLQLTIRRGDYEMMERLLLAGADIDARDVDGNTALHFAAQLARYDAAQILLRHGASLAAQTPRGFSPVTLAVQSGCIPLVQLLLDHGGDVNQPVHDYDLKRQSTLLHWAIECNNIRMVDFLLRTNADANLRDSYGETCLHYAARLGHLDSAELLLRHGARVRDKSLNELTALCYAVKFGHKHMLEPLLQHGATLTERGLGGATLLHYAVKNDDAEFADMLVRRGARVDAANRFGATALHCAISGRKLRALEMLFEHGADVNSQDAFGKTSLHMAIECRRKELYEPLLQRGAAVDARDATLQTPLHFAVKQGSYTAVELLLRHGADANARDCVEQTPLHVAVRRGHARLLGPLLRHSVNVDALDARGRSPLHLAVDSEHSRLVYCGYPYTIFARLLDGGARVCTSDSETGETPLHVAVKRGCAVFVKHLLAAGADVHAAAGPARKTPLRLAADGGFADCVDQLLVYGANTADVHLHEVDRAVAQSFARHFARRRAAAMPLDRRYCKMLVADDDEFAERCQAEVRRMRLTRLSDEHTFYEFLRGNRRWLANFVSNGAPCVIFADHARVEVPAEESPLRKIFPLYADMLDKNYRVAVRYAPLLDAAFERLVDLLKLPAVPADRVLDFLTVVDMENVIEAMSSPKNPC